MVVSNRVLGGRLAARTVTAFDTKVAMLFLGVFIPAPVASFPTAGYTLGSCVSACLPFSVSITAVSVRSR